MRTVKVFEEAWPLHTPFVIARGSRSEARVVVVELEEEGIKGDRRMHAVSALWGK